MPKPIFVIQIIDQLSESQYRHVIKSLEKRLSDDYYVLFIQGRKEDKMELFSVENIDPILFEQLKEEVYKIIYS